MGAGCGVGSPRVATTADEIITRIGRLIEEDDWDERQQELDKLLADAPKPLLLKDAVASGALYNTSIKTRDQVLKRILPEYIEMKRQQRDDAA